MERQKKQGSDVKRENDRGKKTKNEWDIEEAVPGWIKISAFAMATVTKKTGSGL